MFIKRFISIKVPSLKRLYHMSVFLLLVLSQTLMADVDSLQISKINDGPYIFWADDTTLAVHYLCLGELETQLFNGEDTIRFKGLCYDSLSTYAIPVNPAQDQLFIYDKIGKIFAFSDPHGEYESLIELLKQARIIDNDLNWNFGDGHLVALGDMFDRGDKVNEILWLLYKLEQQAASAGGKVHYILGNHEIMPLQKDLRYINDVYPKGICLKLEKTYDQLYDASTVIGRWLRTKKIAVKINKIIYVHAGLSTDLIKYNLTLADINRIMMNNIDTPRDIIKADDTLNHLFKGKGPVWYRGYHYDMEKYKQATGSQVDSILNFYSAGHIVVGHTVLDSIEVLYESRIFGINQDYEIKEEFKGLLWENGQFISIDINGERKVILTGGND